MKHDYNTTDLELDQYYMAGNQFPQLKGDAPEIGTSLCKIHVIKMLRDTFRDGQTLLPTLQIPGLAEAKWTVEKRFFPYEGINPDVPETIAKRWCAGVVAHSILWELQRTERKSS